jgi:nitrogen fixation/metabolism regulation signal transduction histidine kinase
MLCKNVFDKTISLIKVTGRTTMYTINQEHQLMGGTDLQSLFSNGLDSIQAHVESKFKYLPSRVPFRTDSKQTEIEILNEDEQDNLMIGVTETIETVLNRILND